MKLNSRGYQDVQVDRLLKMGYAFSQFSVANKMKIASQKSDRTDLIRRLTLH